MTAPNHALTGALIGLTVGQPLLAMPLAVLSHFVCDAVPHYDPPGENTVARIRSKQFIAQQLVIGAALCGLIVMVLFMARPQQWLIAAICAFLATSPDLFWIPRFLQVKKTGKDIDLNHSHAFLRFHSAIQWKTGPQLWWVEVIYAVGLSAIIWKLI